MPSPCDYRQRVPDLRRRLDAIVRDDPKRPPDQGRKLVDTTGNRSRAQGFKTDEARLYAYAQRRYASVARILVLLEVVRDSPGRLLASPTVEASGAWWQAFKGNDEFNACHTCPCLLLFDGLLPTQLTVNPGLRRMLVAEFADCMLMPRTINAMDKLVDEGLGRSAFVHAAGAVLNTPAMKWDRGLGAFDAQMADVYDNARAVLSHPEPHRTPRPAEQEAALDVLCTYYEGMEAARRNRKAFENFRLEVLMERGVA
jgi:hypothetical protein